MIIHDRSKKSLCIDFTSLPFNDKLTPDQIKGINVYPKISAKMCIILAFMVYSKIQSD